MWALEDIAVEFTEEPEDTLVFVRFVTPDGEIHACGELELRGRTLIVDGLHMHGWAANLLGQSGLRALAQKVMEIADVEELVVRGGTRASGANPGHTPRPVRFRRRLPP